MERLKKTPFAFRTGTIVRPSRQRSAVTNGKRMFVEGDGNSAWTRRFKDLIQVHLADLGGRDAVSEAEFSLIKRASAIETELEQMEGKLSLSQAVDLNNYQRLSNTLRRLLESVGLQRRPRDITPRSMRDRLLLDGKAEAAE
jgi:hypothetical protein